MDLGVGRHERKIANVEGSASGGDARFSFISPLPASSRFLIAQASQLWIRKGNDATDAVMQELNTEMHLIYA